MYLVGGVYINKISHCKDSVGFCGLKTFYYRFPESIKLKLVELIKNEDIAKRVNIPNWKAGKTISTEMIIREAPEIISWYKNFGHSMSGLIGDKLEITSLSLPTSCCILIYDEKDDYINWHFDVNYFNGRFFTVLLPITNDETCTKFVYRDASSDERDVNIRNNLGVIFEGDNLFHMASKLCSNQRRAILSLQYSTDSMISPMNRMLMGLKDMAYV
jgi:hypothetical protein